jgi:hypothetical protein
MQNLRSELVPVPSGYPYCTLRTPMHRLRSRLVSVPSGYPQNRQLLFAGSGMCKKSESLKKKIEIMSRESCGQTVGTD